MDDRTMQAALSGDLELQTERLMPHPRTAVWAAFTDPVRLASWWGPRGFTNRTRAIELRPGGDWQVSLVGLDGKTYENVYRFVELSGPERFVVEHRSGHWFRLTVELHEAPGGTRVTWRQTFGSRAERDELASVCIPGNEQNLERLAAHLAGEGA